MRRHRLRSTAMIATTAITVLALVACGSSDSGESGSSDSSGDVTSSDWYQAAQANIETATQGTDGDMPATGPVAATGKSVWVISCDSSAPGCATPASGAEEAAKAIGWGVQVFDGKSDPTKYAEGIRSAITAKADALILDSVDCRSVKQPLAEARAAGLKVYGINSFDCDDPITDDGGEAMFDGSNLMIGDQTYADYLDTVFGPTQADYAITQTEGKAKVIELTETDLVVTQHLAKGFESGLEKCTSCEIVKTVPITLSDLVGGKLQEKVSAALTQHPEANVIYAQYDATILLGVGQAAVAANRPGLITIGSEGLEPNVELIKEGKGQSAAFGPAAWRAGWAAIDGLNRIFAGEPAVSTGIGLQLIDKDHLPTDPAYYDGNFDESGKTILDYRSGYKKIWGVG
ncbi:sugar ABC transporter substrate-binding protein [Nocardioides sp.]|uniref:sugar ABC transporter substrate-binding protein n=1 Tax=Nocardioides sp. TaxID=35761 RepID=UPI0039E2DD5F